MGDKKVLSIGLVCLDIINVVDRYPEEDTDSRCSSQRWQRGGNASNSCTVLSLLGAPCAFMGSLAPGPVAEWGSREYTGFRFPPAGGGNPVYSLLPHLAESASTSSQSLESHSVPLSFEHFLKNHDGDLIDIFVLNDFQKYNIDISLLSEHAQCSFPASVVISNVTTGSRTILHMNSFIVGDFSRRGVDISAVAWQQVGETPCACCVVCPTTGSRTVLLSDMNLPDVSVADFSKVDLSQYKWIHWEGRNAEEQVQMIQQVVLHNNPLPQQHRITISVEIEKTREPLYQLFPHGDVVFVSKDVAVHFGFHSAEAAVRGLYSRVKKGAILICAWAEKGADAMGPDGSVVHSDAFPPEALVDTLGAGDTFNAAVIYTLSNGGSVQEALTYGCEVAGRKCGIHGYDGIVMSQSDKQM